MTKPITAAAALVLVQQGRIGLDEPVDRLLPELAHRRALVRTDTALTDTVRADRPITVRDLLTLYSRPESMSTHNRHAEDGCRRTARSSLADGTQARQDLVTNDLII